VKYIVYEKNFFINFLCSRLYGGEGELSCQQKEDEKLSVFPRIFFLLSLSGMAKAYQESVLLAFFLGAMLPHFKSGGKGAINKEEMPVFQRLKQVEKASKGCLC